MILALSSILFLLLFSTFDLSHFWCLSIMVNACLRESLWLGTYCFTNTFSSNFFILDLRYILKTKSNVSLFIDE